MMVMFAIAVWIGVAVLGGVLVGRIVRRRDFEVDDVVQTEMAGIDDEYEALVRGGAR